MNNGNIKVSIHESSRLNQDVKVKNKYFNNLKDIKSLSKKVGELKRTKINNINVKNTIDSVCLVIKDLRNDNRSYTSVYKYYNLKYKCKRFNIKINDYVNLSVIKKEDIKANIKKLKENVIKQIKDTRSDVRYINPKIQNYFVNDSSERFNVELVQGVHLHSNTFLNQYNRKYIKSLFESKSPRTNDRYIGIELECFSPFTRENVAYSMYKAGLKNNVCIKTDGSIKPPGQEIGMEINILAKESDYEEVITKVCNVLSENKARVNQSCGLHVHFDMRSRELETIKTIFSNLVSAQPILYAMNPESRRNNHYCQKNKVKSFSSSGDRYKGINGAAYSKYETIEVRIHSGSINKVKVTNWVKLLLSIVNTKKKVLRTPKRLSTFIKNYKVDSELAVYIANRIEKFNDDSKAKVVETNDYIEDSDAA